LLDASHRFPPETELVPFRIAQEPLRNIYGHYKISRVWSNLEFADDKVSLTVKDNDQGFSLPERIKVLVSSSLPGYISKLTSLVAR